MSVVQVMVAQGSLFDSLGPRRVLALLLSTPVRDPL